MKATKKPPKYHLGRDPSTLRWAADLCQSDAEDAERKARIVDDPTSWEGYAMALRAMAKNLRTCATRYERLRARGGA